MGLGAYEAKVSSVEVQRLPSDHQRTAICQLHEHPRGARVLLLPRNPPVAASTLETWTASRPRRCRRATFPKVTRRQKDRLWILSLWDVLTSINENRCHSPTWIGGQAGRQVLVLAPSNGDLPFSPTLPVPSCKPSRLAAKTLKHIQIADSILNIPLFLKLLILGNFHELQGGPSQRQDDGHTQETTQKGGHGQNQPADIWSLANKNRFKHKVPKRTNCQSLRQKNSWKKTIKTKSVHTYWFPQQQKLSPKIIWNCRPTIHRGNLQSPVNPKFSHLHLQEWGFHMIENLPKVKKLRNTPPTYLLFHDTNREIIIKTA